MAINFTLKFGTKWDAIATSALADGGTAESSSRDNSGGEMAAWVIVKCSNGTGSDADGSTLYVRPTLDGGTTYADAVTFIVGTLPSPNSSTVIRAFLITNLPPEYKLGIDNETGAAADYDIDVIEFHVEKA